MTIDEAVAERLDKIEASIDRIEAVSDADVEAIAKLLEVELKKGDAGVIAEIGRLVGRKLKVGGAFAKKLHVVLLAGAIVPAGEVQSQGWFDWLTGGSSTPGGGGPGGGGGGSGGKSCDRLMGELDGLQAAYDIAHAAYVACKNPPVSIPQPGQSQDSSGGGETGDPCAALRGVVDGIADQIAQKAQEIVQNGCITL